MKVPKYYRIKSAILALIEGLPPGSAVPTERELAEEFDTSRTTVRQAIAELVVEDAGSAWALAVAPGGALGTEAPLSWVVSEGVDAEGRLRGVVTFEQVTRALRARLAPSRG